MEWISNDVKNWTSNAYKNLLWLSGGHFSIKVDKLMTFEESCIEC